MKVLTQSGYDGLLEGISFISPHTLLGSNLGNLAALALVPFNYTHYPFELSVKFYQIITFPHHSNIPTPGEKGYKMECWLLPTSDPGWPNVVAIDDQGLVMSFRRTIRVPETETVSTPLPDLGAFPLYAVDQFKDKLPDDVSSKGGLFFPMHREL